MIEGAAGMRRSEEFAGTRVTVLLYGGDLGTAIRRVSIRKIFVVVGNPQVKGLEEGRFLRPYKAH